MDSNVQEALRIFALQKMRAIEKEKKKNPTSINDNEAENVGTSCSLECSFDNKGDTRENIACIDEMDPKEKKSMFSAIIQSRIAKEIKEGLSKLEEKSEQNSKKVLSVPDVDKDMKSHNNGREKVADKKAIQIKIFSKDLSETNVEKTKTDDLADEEEAEPSSDEETAENKRLLPWREVPEEGELTPSSISDVEAKPGTNVEIEKSEDKDSKRESKKKKHKHKHKHKKGKYKKSKHKSKEKSKDKAEGKHDKRRHKSDVDILEQQVSLEIGDKTSNTEYVKHKEKNDKRKHKDDDDRFKKRTSLEIGDKQSNAEDVKDKEKDDKKDSISKVTNVVKDVVNINEIPETVEGNIKQCEREHTQSLDEVESETITNSASLSEDEIVTEENPEKETVSELIMGEKANSVVEQPKEANEIVVTQEEEVVCEIKEEQNPGEASLKQNVVPIQESSLDTTLQSPEETHPVNENTEEQPDQTEAEKDRNKLLHFKSKKRKRDKTDKEEDITGKDAVTIQQSVIDKTVESPTEETQPVSKNIKEQPDQTENEKDGKKSSNSKSKKHISDKTDKEEITAKDVVTVQQSVIDKTMESPTEETQAVIEEQPDQTETEKDGKKSSHSKSKKRKRDKTDKEEGQITEKHKKKSRDGERKRKDSRRSRSRSKSRKHRRSRSHSPSHRTSDRHRHRSRSCSRDKSSYKTKTRSRSRSRDKNSYKTKTSRMYSDRRRSRSPAERIDKAKLLEIAKANAYAQMKAGLLPANMKLPPLSNEDKASQRAGGQTINELTAVCQAIQKKGEGMDSDDESPINRPVDSDDEESRSFINHPFKLKPQIQSIVVNIKNAVQRPPNMDKDKLRIQFPVSSGSQHRKKEEEVSPYGAWVPYQKPTTQPAATESKAPTTDTSTATTDATTTATTTTETTTTTTTEMPTMAAGGQLSFPVNQTATSVLSPLVPTPAPAATPATAPAAPPTSVVDPKDRVFEEAKVPSLDIATMVSARLKAARALESNPLDIEALGQLHKAQRGIQSWVSVGNKPGQFTGSTGVQILNAKELANSNPRAQAWAKKDMFLKSAPVRSGIGMMMLQRMGWRQGEGLGKNKEGSKEPILLEIKSDRKGLVAATEAHRGKPPAARVVTHDLTSKHPVSALMEICNKRKWKAPSFELIHDSGPSHQKNFVFKVFINNEQYQPTTASSNKKQAKAQAATVALQKMGLIPMDYVHKEG